MRSKMGEGISIFRVRLKGDFSKALCTVFSILLFLPHLHSALEEREELLDVKTLFEASDFERGEARIKKEEAMVKEEWKRSYLIYDRAFGAVLKASYSEAVPLLDDAARHGKAFPPLSSKSSYAKVYALYNKLKSASENGEGSKSSFRELRESLRLSSRVKEAFADLLNDECRLDKVKGAKECKNPPYFNVMLGMALNFKSKINDKYYASRAKQFTPVEALLQLYIGMEKTLIFLTSMTEAQSKDVLVQHLKVLSAEMESFQIVIDQISLPATEEIRDAWTLSIVEMRQGELEKSRMAVDRLQKKVKALLSSLFKEEEATKALYRLSEAFQEAFLEQELIPNSLRSLAFLLEETLKIKNVQELVPKELIEFLKSHIASAIAFKEAGKGTESESEFLFADFGVKSALLFVLEKEKAPVRGILKLLISLADNLVQQDALYPETDPQKMEKWREGVLFAISTLLDKTELFNKASFKEQQDQFSGQSKEHPGGPSCVASPWGRVIPPFDEGVELIGKSYRLMELTKPNVFSVSLMHSQALENWVLALQEMDNLSPYPGCGGAGGGGKEEGEDEAEATGGEGIEETLRNIVQMGEDDKEFEEKKELPKKESGKPW